jgi:ATP-dependent HslUV protease ATP-binding subunit HslU
VKDEIEGKGIIVIDEIDKLVRSPESTSSTKASDEGVQYDLLPLLDGTTISINTKIKINTRNILFVGAGAFEKTKPTELAIELQGRMPVRAKMEPLSLEDFKHILTDTDHNLLDQTVELLKIENLNVVFDKEAIDEIARISVELNEEDNIGARRLRTVLDSVLEEINFEAPDFEEKNVTIVIGGEYVREMTKALFANRDFR